MNGLSLPPARPDHTIRLSLVAKPLPREAWSWRAAGSRA